MNINANEICTAVKSAFGVKSSKLLECSWRLFHTRIVRFAAESVRNGFASDANVLARVLPLLEWQIVPPQFLFCVGDSGVRMCASRERVCAARVRNFSHRSASRKQQQQ